MDHTFPYLFFNIHFHFFLTYLMMLSVLRPYSIDVGLINECGTVGGMRICPPQIEDFPTWDEIWAAVMGIRLLTI
jgi:hypothetical protein